jgi:hypothetical protein
MNSEALQAVLLAAVNAGPTLRCHAEAAIR